MTNHWGRWLTGAFTAAILTGAVGVNSAAFAGSDNSTDTYAGDANGLALPTGTFLILDYSGYRHADAYIQNNNNLFGKVGNPKTIPSDINVYTDIIRFTYFTTLFNHPLVLEAAGAFEKVDANIGNQPFFNPVTLTGPVSKADGFTDPVLFFTYGVDVEPQNERYIGLSNYFYLPTGRRYDNTRVLNVATPHQLTWVPQIEGAEGLTKFGLKNFWIDYIVNASIHSDGDSPVFSPLLNAGFSNLTQDNSYDVKGFIRYQFAQSFWIAVGVEKSWGGNQVASGGLLGLALGSTSLGKDDFTKGHIQASYPLTPDLHIAADITHDFQRDGGPREDITAEVRMTKFFLPTQESLK